MSAERKPPKSKKTKWKAMVILAVFVAVIVALSLSGMGKHLEKMKGWIEGFGIWAPLVIIGVYAVATVAAVPGSALTIIAGGLFGSVRGVVIVSVASTLGACLAFLVSRYLLRRRVVDGCSLYELGRQETTVYENDEHDAPYAEEDKLHSQQCADRYAGVTQRQFPAKLIEAIRKGTRSVHITWANST